MILHNGRIPVEVPMILDGNGRYRFSEDLLEQGLAAVRREGRRVPLILFSSPHNPGGAVWDQEELEMLSAFARKEGMILVSDEIHGDFVFPPKTFVSAAAFPDYADRMVILSGANKTFNLGGLQGSHFIVRDSGLRRKLKEELRAMAFSAPNLFFLSAVEAAYREGGPWLAELKVYLRDNMAAAVSGLNQGIPGLRACLPEGTYLIWADVSAPIRRLGLRDDQELARRLELQGRVKVSPGSSFGAPGAGFIRINAACPRSQLMEGIARIQNACL
jgi:cystathionine beta-lyase